MPGCRFCALAALFAALLLLPTGLHGLPRWRDQHRGSTRASGGRFLAGLVPGMLRALGPRGLLFLTFDEGSSDEGCCRLASGGHIVTIVAGGGARAHARLARPTDHYSVLQTIEDLLGLRRLRGAACACTPSLQPLLAAEAAG